VNLQRAIWLPVATGIVALALAGGGFSAATLGAATVVLWLLLGGLLIGGRIGLGALSPRLGLLLASLVALVVWTALSLGWAADAAAGYVDLVRLLLYLGVVLTVGLAARPGTGPSWLTGIAVGGVVVALLALGSRLLGFGGDEQIAIELRPAAERLSYPIGYWNGLGYLLAMTLPALLWLAVGGRRSIAGLALAGSIPLIAALFLTSSRGAWAAAAIALLIAGSFAVPRRRLLLAALVAVPAWALAVLVTAALRDELDAVAGPTVWGPALLLLIVGLGSVAYLGWAALEARPQLAPARPLARRRVQVGIGACLALLAALVVAVGPDAFVGEFRSEGASAEGGTGEGLVSGSGRSSFWGAALEAFEEDPLRGVGAGGYEIYWNANGDLRVPARNAHSAPLETLAELGLPGAIALLGAIVLALAAAPARLRGSPDEGGAVAAAALGIFAAGLIAIGVDWTWELPAALAPFLVALALLGGRGLEPGDTATGSLLVDARIAGYERQGEPAWLLPWAARLGIGSASVVALWAGAVLALAAIQLERSADRLADGDLSGAAEAARSAARIEPWSQEPSLRLAEIEQAAANFEAARRRAEEAARLAPEDFRPWLLLSRIHAADGELALAAVYATRARALAPRAFAPSRPVGVT
jgi:O-antigen ligase